MTEPALKYCTVREGGDEWHLECRFSDGQKYAAIRVDGECPRLAERVSSLLNGNAWTDERPTEPGTYWLSKPPKLRSVPRDRMREVVLKVTEWHPTELQVFDVSGILLGPLNHIGWLDGAKWSRRETPADPFEE